MNFNSGHNKTSLTNQNNMDIKIGRDTIYPVEDIKGNMSTSSTDSGVVIIDKSQSYENNNNDNKSESKIANNKKDQISENNNKSSPCASLRSLSISIVSIDDNNSSVVDSDFETDATATEGNKYVIHKLGVQTTIPPGGVEISQINRGLKVVSQVISQNDQVSEEFTTNERAASNLGAIAVSNSSDVTFGDKHYYEGPVTIQQFLIDSREKEDQNESLGQTNAGFNAEMSTKNAYSNDTTTKGFSENLQTESGFFGTVLNQRKICLLVLLMMALLALTFSLIYALFPGDMRTSKLSLDGDSTRLIYPTNSDLDDYLVQVSNKTLRIVKREAWHARPSKSEMTLLKLPVSRVIIAHTATEMCQIDRVCIESMRIMQDYHMDSQNWADIGYNFVIGGSGKIFIGRDWPYQGAHTLGYNADSIGVAFIGTYELKAPFKEQIEALELLLEWGVEQHKLIPNYRLYGAKQLMATVSPGAQLYSILKNFTHWSSTI